MATSRILTFKGAFEGSDSATLTLAFVPPGVDIFNKVFPIAWKVLTISGTKSSTPLVWNDVFGGSRVDVNPNTETAISDEYEPVTLHQTTNLLLDNTRRPPAYHFSEPVTSQDPTTAEVVNRAGKYVDIGSGYITGSDPNTEFNTVLVWRSVPDSSTVDISYTPVLTIWANLPGVTESQVLLQAPNVTPLWQGDLTKTLGSNLTFTVSRKGGRLVVDGPKIFPGLATASAQGVEKKIVTEHPAANYTAELAFASPLLAFEGAAAIAKQLVQHYYPIKVIHQVCSTQARLELGLPLFVSCNEAEQDVLNAIKRLPNTYGKVFISGHSASTLLLIEDWIEKWSEINPASRQWFDATAVNVANTNAAFDGTNGDAFAKANPDELEIGKGVNGIADPATVPNGNGLVITDVEAAAPAAQETKFRSVRRAGGSRRPALPFGA
ncbi:hypothetical protein C8Q78DRAFT_241455 [Trametes maxima]|nr:hypothetical protein C8Q78DRAFT_241455 [Trametes maxima]